MKRSLLNSVRPRASSLIVALCALAGAAALAGCNAGGPISIASTYGPGIKFSGLGATYAWAPDAAEQRVGSAGFHELVRGSVEKHLAAKGFALNSTGTAGFWMDYRVERREKTYAGAVAFGETIEEGSLVLEVLDPATRQFLWRGIARARIMDSDPPEVRRQRLEAAMRGLMEKFPKKA